MKTLWEKMSEENRNKIQVSDIGYLIEALQKKVAWSDLRVFELMQLFEALEINEFNFIHPLDNIFYGKK
jgi:hypothetical protein